MSEDKVDKILEERGKIYGNAVETHEQIGQMWSIILSRYNRIEVLVPAHLVALCMISLKSVRLSARGSQYHTDTLDDIEGYRRIFRMILDEEAARDTEAKGKVSGVFECGHCGVHPKEGVYYHFIHEEFEEYICEACFEKENQKTTPAQRYLCDHCKVITTEPFELEYEDGLKQTVCKKCHKNAREEPQPDREPTLLPEKKVTPFKGHLKRPPFVEMMRFRPRTVTHVSLKCHNCHKRRALDGKEEHEMLWYAVMNDHTHMFSGCSFCENCVERAVDMNTMRVVE